MYLFSQRNTVISQYDNLQRARDGLKMTLAAKIQPLLMRQNSLKLLVKSVKKQSKVNTIQTDNPMDYQLLGKLILLATLKNKGCPN